MPTSLIDIIVITINEWTNELHGRVRLHKTVYLAQKLRDIQEIKFRPYYYGPYSDELSSALTASENLRLLEVKKETIEHSYDGQRDIIEYIYSLNDDGNEYFIYLKRQKEEEFKKWQAGIKPVVGEFSDSRQKTSQEMAMAAKIIFLLGEGEGTQTISMLKKKAQEYKWPVDDDLFKSGLQHLENLGLAKKKV